MYQIYQVKPNDSLASIATKHNIAIDELRKINGFNLNTLLEPGMNIVVPKRDNEIYTTYVVKKGDNLYSIADANNISLRNLLLINGLKEGDYIYPGQELLIPLDGVEIYITENDTLYDAANKMGAGIDEIINQNKTIYLLPEQIIFYKKRGNN